MQEPIKTTTNYVDKEYFYGLMQDRAVQVAMAKGKPVRVSEEIGKILFDIAHNLSYRKNFINYNFRDDMVGDGIENCLTYVDNFDCTKSQNPFAYFTQICFWAFVRRIKKEQSNYELKTSVKSQEGLDWESFAVNDFDRNEHYFNTRVDTTL